MIPADCSPKSLFTFTVPISFLHIDLKGAVPARVETTLVHTHLPQIGDKWVPQYHRITCFRDRK